MSSFAPPANSPFSSSSSQPWVWVLIPVGIIIVIAAAAFFLHSRRRKQIPPLLPTTMSSGLPTLHNLSSYTRSRSRAFNERDLAPESIQNGRQPGTNGRWHWSQTTPAAARPEEGFNELGEAPPPYEKQLAPPLHNLTPTLEDEGDETHAGPAPKLNSPSSASSIHGGPATMEGREGERGVEGGSGGGVEMHTLAPVITGRTFATTITTSSISRSTSTSSLDFRVGGGGGSVCGLGSGYGIRAGASRDPLSLFALANSPSTLTVPSTAFSSSPSLGWELGPQQREPPADGGPGAPGTSEGPGMEGMDEDSAQRGQGDQEGQRGGGIQTAQDGHNQGSQSIQENEHGQGGQGSQEIQVSQEVRDGQASPAGRASQENGAPQVTQESQEIPHSVITPPPAALVGRP